MGRITDKRRAKRVWKELFGFQEGDLVRVLLKGDCILPVRYNIKEGHENWHLPPSKFVGVISGRRGDFYLVRWIGWRDTVDDKFSFTKESLELI